MYSFRIRLIFLFFFLGGILKGQGIISIAPSDSVFVCKGDTAYWEISHNADSIVWIPLNGQPSFQLDTGYVYTLNSTTFQLVAYFGGSPVDTDTVFQGVVEGGILAPDFTCIGVPTNISFQGNGGWFSSIYWNFGGANPPSATTLGPHDVTWGAQGYKYITQIIIGHGCVDTVVDSVYVLPFPAISAGSDKIYCKPGPGVQIDGQLFNPPPGCSVIWTPSAGLSDPSIPNPIASPDTTTTYVMTVTCTYCGSISDTVTVFVSERPEPVILNNPIAFCQGTGGDTIFTQVNNGTPPYTYTWSPAVGLSSSTDSFPIASPTASTSYKLVVTDSMGCASDSVEAFVVVKERPIVNAGPDLYLCKDAPGDTLSGQIINYLPGQVNFYWTPATGLSSPTLLNPYAKPDSTTIYTLMAIEPATQCTSVVDTQAMVTVYIVSLPVSAAGYEDTVRICPGDSVQIGAVGGNGDTLGFTYVWTPSIGLNATNIPDPMASPPYTVTYYVQVSAKGCISPSDSITVEVRPFPQVIIQPVPAICPGDTIQLNAFVASSFNINELSFQWSPAWNISNDTILNPQVFPDSSVTYVLHTSYKGLCSVEDSVRVNVVGAPLIGLEGRDTTICQGDTIILPATIPDTLNFSGVWTPDMYLSNPNIPNPSAFPDTSIMYVYSINYQSASSSCSANDTFFINVLHSPDISFWQDTSKVCAGDTIRIVGEGDLGSADFFWYQNDSLILQGLNRDTLILVPTDSVKITLILQEDICQDKDSLFINVEPRPEVSFTFAPERICFGNKVYFTNLTQGGDFYVWNFGDGALSNEINPAYPYDSVGSFTVTLTATNYFGCTDSAFATKHILVNPKVQAGFYSVPSSDSVLVLPQATVEFKDTSQGNIVSWLWLFGNNESSVLQNPVYTYDAPGFYDIMLIVEDDNECTDTAYAKISVRRPELDIPNVFTPNGDGVNDEFIIKYDGIEQYEVLIYDRDGKNVFSTTSPNIYWNGKKNNSGQELPAGTYFYVVNIGTEKQYKGTVTLIR